MAVQARRSWTEYVQPQSWPFWGVHLVAVLGVVYSGWSWSGAALAVGLYYARMFFVTAGCHRYFSHRSFKTSRAFQFLLGVGFSTSMQKGVLWWAANHRHHHKYSDQPGDIHSPVVGGFWWSQVGWILTNDHKKTLWGDIRDMAKYPELRWLNRYHYLPGWALGAALLYFGGWTTLLWGFFVSTTLLWHGTFTINSLSHIIGRRRYETDDDSRNNWVLALITMGEGWHNNHHHHMNSANQGFFWWEIDMSYMMLKFLSFFGVVWDLRKPPKHILEGRPRRVDPPVLEPPVELPKAA